jgi:hypothetical protein
MMGDPHKYFLDRLKIKYKAQPYTNVKDDCDNLKSTDKWIEKLCIKIIINNINLKLIFALPNTFPYDYPSIFFHTDNSGYKYLPHVDNNLFICTFDKQLSIPNIHEPLNICDAVIQKAIKIISDGLNKANYIDYEDEFLAYWDEVSNVFSIVKPSNYMKQIQVIEVRELIKNTVGISHIVCDNYQDGLALLKSLCIKCDKDKMTSKKGLYLPIGDANFERIPECNKDIPNFLKNKQLSKYYEKLRSLERPAFVLCDYSKDDKHRFFAWEHPECIDTVWKGNIKKKINHQKGFRKGHQLIGLEITGFNKDAKIKRYRVHRLDKERLLSRGGEGLNVDNKYSINLIGCGSIGSFLLNKLVYMGFDNFNLVDDEILKAENIARHIGSLADLYSNKTEALKDIMLRRFPTLKISTQQQDIKSILLNPEMNLMNDHHLNIICIGHYTTELMINNYIKDGTIKSPCLFVWVEPNLIAAHAVYINPNDIISLEDLHEYNKENNKYMYEYSLADPSIEYIKRESGCQSSYTPYAALDIDDFTNKLAYTIKEISEEKYTESTIFRWVKNYSIINSKWEIIDRKNDED